MEFKVLGPLAVEDSGTALAIGPPMARTLLAALLARARRPVSMETLIEALWAGSPPKTAIKNTQLYVHHLRRGLGAPERIRRHGSGYLLEVEREELDADKFQDIAQAGHDAAEQGDLTQARELFQEALAQWAGPAFADIGDIPLITSVRQRLAERRLAALHSRIDIDLHLGSHADVVGELTELAAEHPLRERIRAQLMVALYRCGRQTEALHAYEDLRRTLREETGLTPGREIQDLQLAILTHDESLQSPGEESVQWPGERPVTGPRMLPADIGDFTGREADLAMIEEVLGGPRDASGRARILAISGLAGVGKTTLAVRAAHRLRDAYPDGQLFARLADGRARPADTAETLAAFLHALGVAGTSVPQGVEARSSLYRSLLAGRRMLVILDNATDEARVRPLLPAGESCGVIVTSRRRLGGLPDAALADLHVMSPEESLSMLRRIVGRHRVNGDPPSTEELSRLCAGLPLALRVVGARLAIRPDWRLSDLAGRLRDERERLSTLRSRDLEVRSSFALSYNALSSDARRMFRLLGLPNVPDIPEWLAAAVLDTSVAGARDLLDELVDARLIDVTPPGEGTAPRYRFHDLVRLYARERAEAEERADERRAALVRAFGALLVLTEIAHRACEGGDHTIVRGDAPRWNPDEVRAALAADAPPMTWFRTERAALVSAVHQAADEGLDAICWELAVGGNPIFQAGCHLDDWVGTHERALAVAEAAGDRRGQAMVLDSLWSAHFARREFAAAAACNERTLELFHELGDAYRHALALRKAAQTELAAGRLRDAVLHGLQAHRLLAGFEDGVAAADALGHVGVAYLEAGEPETAIAVLREVVATAGEFGAHTLRTIYAYWLGHALLVLGRAGEAESVFLSLYRKATSSFDRIGLVYARHATGCLHLARGDGDAARHDLTTGLEAAREAYDPLMRMRILIALGDLHRIEGDLDAARALFAEAIEAAEDLGAAVWAARALERSVAAHTAAGDAEAAERARAEARRIRSVIDPPPPAATVLPR